MAEKSYIKKVSLYAMWWLKATYLIGLASLIVAKLLLPEFLKYGKTLSKPRGQGPSWQRIAYRTVPKSYFAHFYILSSTLSVITVCRYPRHALVWLLLFHSLRRLYETLYVSQYSIRSRMNWSHYAVGLWFYSSLNIILNVELYKKHITRSFNMPALILFCVAAWDQYENHKVLAALVKYSLPQQRLFRWICCPHYLDEILIYCSLLSASREFVWPLIWVCASLCLSATECKRYYKVKYPGRAPPYALVPFVL
ncbi:related to Polyprenol reductase [Zygosaccharomyces bailii]|uniref:Polyprenal reductase n=1 Tax=Zygosaccharomyces bailii (strain CLIB 213 / ATCC 58445 / CBS 680 / BCRC 21525 / NBRC 1098 / NCYC 1416 / NRRL Y-2227) TaxID=1333698 RepID=A0A8J2T506_ZYGB2|nr:BN860_01464g1_1 [Zygosaccharomyces bailii CLIB 213]SJM87372.1 related to Polyprenol reductase [Zygosaccharomyces bailii]